MLLSNLTASSTACSVLLSLNIPIVTDPKSSNPLYPTQSRCGTCTAPTPYPTGETREVLALPLLIKAFVDGAQVNPSTDPFQRKRKGELHFLSSVFANLSVVGRLKKIIRWTEIHVHFRRLLVDLSSSHLGQ